MRKALVLAMASPPPLSACGGKNSQGPSGQREAIRVIPDSARLAAARVPLSSVMAASTLLALRDDENLGTEQNL